jgi:hypothetical protein
LRGIYFTQAGTGWAVGRLGTILGTVGEEEVDSSFAVSVDGGWNLVSVPTGAEDLTAGSLFPDATSSAFAYDEGYVASDTLEPGRGYWLKFPAAQSVPMPGPPIEVETVDVAAEWNIVGAIGTQISVSTISSVPGGIVTSNFFGYNGGYEQSTVLVPGQGYWVKASQAGQLVLSSSGQTTATSMIRIMDRGEAPPAPPDRGGSPAADVPSEFSLAQNSPNPFNPTTVIGFSLPDRSRVTLVVYDVLGREMARLVDGDLDGEEHTASWDARGVPSGVYMYRLVAGGNTAVKKLLLLR